MSRLLVWQIDNLPIHQNSFIVYDDSVKRCVIVDPFLSEPIISFLVEQKLTIDYVFLTHEHYDHIGAVNILRNLYEFSLVSSSKCSERIGDPRKNLASFFQLQLRMTDREDIDTMYQVEDTEYACKEADIVFLTEKSIDWLDNSLDFYLTPGHTDSSACMLINGVMLFSGDTLLWDNEVSTKLPSGSKKDYREITEPFLGSLDGKMHVYPGHGRTFRLGEKSEWSI